MCCCAEGVASPSDIDRCMKLGANHPMGPLALCDMIGLDTILSVMEVLHREFGDDKYRCAAECPPPPLPPCLPLLSPGARLRTARMAAREKFFPAARNPSSSSWSRSWPAEGWADLSSPIERLLPAACCLLLAARARCCARWWPPGDWAARPGVASTTTVEPNCEVRRERGDGPCLVHTTGPDMWSGCGRLCHHMRIIY